MADGAAFGGGGGFEGGVRGAGGGAEHGAAHDRVLSRAELEAMGVKELKARSLVITPGWTAWFRARAVSTPSLSTLPYP